MSNCELYLRVPARFCVAEGVFAAFGGGDVTALLITDIEGSGVNPDDLAVFVALAGSQNVAVLIENDVDLAKRLDADGVHLRAQTLSAGEATKRLGGGKVVGVSSPLTRHDAMVAAEEGAGYVAFGEGDADDLEAVAAMIRWWNEIFEVPCVGWVHEGHDENAFGALIAAGADFISVPFARALDADAAAEIARLAQLCAKPRPVE